MCVGFSIPSSTREAAMKNVGEQQPGKPQDASGKFFEVSMKKF